MYEKVCEKLFIRMHCQIIRSQIHILLITDLKATSKSARSVSITGKPT